MKESNLPTESKNKQRLLLVFALIFAIITVVFTIIVKNIDIRAIGPENSSVGLSSLNEFVRNLFPYGDGGINELWYKITKYSGYLLFLPPIFFSIFGFVQLVYRKSFKKVDLAIKLLAIFYIATIATLAIFRKMVINYRPVLLDGALEASYPSSHTLFAITVCGSTMLLTSRLLKLKHAKLVNVILLAVMLVTIIGRLLSGVHWCTDILAGTLIALTLVFAFAGAIVRIPSNKEGASKTSGDVHD